MEVVLEVQTADAFDDSPAEYVKVDLDSNFIERILYLRNIAKQADVFQLQEFNYLPVPCSRNYDDPADTDEKPVIRELSPEEFRSECMTMDVTEHTVNWSFYQKHGTSLHTTEGITIDDLLQNFCNTELLNIFAGVGSVATIGSDGKLTSQAQVC